MNRKADRPKRGKKLQLEPESEPEATSTRPKRSRGVSEVKFQSTEDSNQDTCVTSRRCRSNEKVSPKRNSSENSPIPSTSSTPKKGGKKIGLQKKRIKTVKQVMSVLMMRVH